MISKLILTTLIVAAFPIVIEFEVIHIEGWTGIAGVSGWIVGCILAAVSRSAFLAIWREQVAGFVLSVSLILWGTPVLKSLVANTVIDVKDSEKFLLLFMCAASAPLFSLGFVFIQKFATNKAKI